MSHIFCRKCVFGAFLVHIWLYNACKYKKGKAPFRQEEKNMPLLTREEMLKKGQYPDNKGANILIEGLRNINEDENAELSGKLGEYIKAISTIVKYGSYKNKKYD